MARDYPRFLYSNPKNTKSKGPFVTSLLEPRIICRVHLGRKQSDPDFDDSPDIRPFKYYQSFALELLGPEFNFDQTGFGNGYGNKIELTLDNMATWLNAQLLSGEIS